MTGHFACNVADRLLAGMVAMPGKLTVHDVSLLGSWRLPGMPTVCACRRRLAPAQDSAHVRAKDHEIRADSGKFASKYLVAT